MAEHMHGSITMWYAGMFETETEKSVSPLYVCPYAAYDVETPHYVISRFDRVTHRASGLSIKGKSALRSYLFLPNSYFKHFTPTTTTTTHTMYIPNIQSILVAGLAMTGAIKKRESQSGWSGLSTLSSSTFTGSWPPIYLLVVAIMNPDPVIFLG